ncbi:TPA: DUF4222 domain-containing protein [Escherichia coli]|nr:DUF4222 domain-containing protein [Escherichia coli]
MIDSNAKLRSIQMPFCTSVEEIWVVFMRDGYPHYCLISLALTISFHENILLINDSGLVATKCKH